MNFIELSNKEYVNVAVIDRQHEMLVASINKIYISIKTNHTDTTKELLHNLVEDIEIHFETEEKLMKEKNFSGYFSHKLEHDRFYNQLVQIVDSIKKTTDVMDENKMSSIKTWFFNHIEIKDKKCGEFLNSIGIN